MSRAAHGDKKQSTWFLVDFDFGDIDGSNTGEQQQVFTNVTAPRLLRRHVYL